MALTLQSLHEEVHDMFRFIIVMFILVVVVYFITVGDVYDRIENTTSLKGWTEKCTATTQVERHEYVDEEQYQISELETCPSLCNVDCILYDNAPYWGGGYWVYFIDIDRKIWFECGYDSEIGVPIEERECMKECIANIRKAHVRYWSETVCTEMMLVKKVV